MTDQLKISGQITEKSEQLENVRSKLKEILNKRSELLSRVSEESEVEEIDEADAELDQLSVEESETKEEIAKLEAEIADLEKELEEVQNNLLTDEDPQEEERNMNTEKLMEQRQALADYIKSKGSVRNETGLISSEVGVLIPEEIAYNPELEVKTVVDLSQFVNRIKVNTASGKYPTLAKPTSKLSSVAELAANPKLAEPAFDEVAWEVETYRGALPISQEAIDDSVVDLTNLVARHAQEIKINTSNFAIATVLKSFDAKTVANADDLKGVFNVDLDPAYDSALIVSQSFFNELDTMKDESGRYLMQDDITSPTGKRVLGRQILAIVPDTDLGVAGEAKAFIGDIRRAVLYADRKELALNWLDSSIYGKYLGVVARFDAVKADAKAGYFVTFSTGA